ncbi:hypothetical protein [Methylobacterium frigidaeris]|nr:hypothetical protein [Methylobacterium frigidaeris]
MQHHSDTASPHPAARGLISRLLGLGGAREVEETPEAAAERRAKQRSEAGAEIARIEAERDAELPALAAAEERARRHLERLTPGYQDAMRAYAAAQGEHTRRAHDFAYGLQRQVRRIETAAEPIIAEFVSDLMELFRENLATPIQEDRRLAGYVQGRGYAPVYEIFSNVPSLDASRSSRPATRPRR